MNLPMVLPRPETIQYKIKDTSYYSSDSTSDCYVVATPYRNEELMRVVATHKVKVPFDRIITRDMGFSICPHCGTRYVGHELECQKQVTFYKTTENQYRWERGERFVGEHFKGDGYWSSRVSEIKTSMCGTSTKWDLQEAFNLQEAFFDFLQMLSVLPEKPTDLMTRFSNCLPEGMEDKYRIALLEQKVACQGLEISRCLDGITQIAQKMQQAGNALSW
jgi:hypothetical protein